MYLLSSLVIILFFQSIHELIRYMLVVDPNQRPFISDVIRQVETLEAQEEGCV